MGKLTVDAEAASVRLHALYDARIASSTVSTCEQLCPAGVN